MKKIIKNILKLFGKQLTQYPDHDINRRFKIMNILNINLLFDIGANDGEYSKTIRQYGYQGRIISFEPLKDAFTKLNISSANDENWVINNYALGSENGKIFINVAGNSVSSSILNMTSVHLNNAPESEYIRKEEIDIKTLNSIYNEFYKDHDNLMIKIDTQGYEKLVLEGANELIDKIKVLQLEMALVTLYENESIFTDMLLYLDELGFQLFSLETGFSDLKTGQLLLVDGIFVNKKYLHIL